MKDRNEKITWAIREQIRNVTSPLTLNLVMAIRKMIKRELVVNYEEAKVVKIIFDKYLQEYSILALLTIYII